MWKALRRQDDHLGNALRVVQKRRPGYDEETGQGGNAVNKDELRQLAQDRILDAKALLAARRWSGAYYLAGYAVECALKRASSALWRERG
jgi:hypothetical protein